MSIYTTLKKIFHTREIKNVKVKPCHAVVDCKKVKFEICLN